LYICFLPCIPLHVSWWWSREPVSGLTPHAPDAALCSACGLEPAYENGLCWNCLPG
jgi:hypothetical protein